MSYIPATPWDDKAEAILEVQRVKLGDLNTSHLGKTITIEGGGESVTSTLCGVEHSAALIDDRQFGDTGPRWIPGRRKTTITLTGWGGREFDPSVECTVDGE